MNKSLVHQGDMVMIARKEYGNPSNLTDNAWYQKLLMDGSQVYRLIQTDDGVCSLDGTMPEIIKPGEIDETYLDVQSGKDFTIIYVVPLDEYIRNIRFAKPIRSASSLIKEQYVSQAMHKITELQHKVSSLDGEMQRYQSIVDSLDRATMEISELSSYIEDVHRGKTKQFTYAFGTHPGIGKEYCWRVPEHLVDSVQVGSQVLCETNQGTDLATITRIQSTTQLLNHKNIICLREDA